MGRKPRESDYALPPLTFAEAARVLGVDEGVFMAWSMKTARPSMSQWSEWTSGKRTIPEKLIRLYLTTQHAESLAPSTIGRRRAERRKAAGE